VEEWNAELSTAQSRYLEITRGFAGGTRIEGIKEKVRPNVRREDELP